MTEVRKTTIMTVAQLKEVLQVNFLVSNYSDFIFQCKLSFRQGLRQKFGLKPN